MNRDFHQYKKLLQRAVSNAGSIPVTPTKKGLVSLSHSGFSLSTMSYRSLQNMVSNHWTCFSALLMRVKIEINLSGRMPGK